MGNFANKYIEYGGKLYTIPNWANYIMHDSTGDIYVYETIPEARLGGVWQTENSWQKVGSVFPSNTEPMSIT